MKIRLLAILISILIFHPTIGISQNFEKVIFDGNDSTDGYYLAIPPLSGNIQGVQVLFQSFNNLEFTLSETKLHNVAYANDILTIIASLKQGLCADSAAIERINTILKHVVTKFSADTSKFALGGFQYAGNIVLRYTELSYEHSSQFLIHPKAVFAIDCPVDLVSLYHWCEREIKKNYFAGNVNDAKYILDALTKENGTAYNSIEKYIHLSPFYKDAQKGGNEQYLKNVPVRLYYDTDINWELKNRRNSFYDTYIIDGSEMVNRLLLLGNNEAEFITSKQPGMRSSGIRNPHSWSIVDEVECIQWIKQKLNIFDPNTYSPQYHLSFPDGWDVERFPVPIDFAPQIPYKGVEDIRFAPGWGDKNSEEYWSYAFLWWLEINTKVSAAALQENLKAYYSGLVARNISRRNIPADKLVTTVANIKKIKTDTRDLETYSGTINMLDYMTQSPMILNVFIHVKSCPVQNHTALFFEISPKPFSHLIWQKLNQLWTDFDCKVDETK